MTRNIFRFGVVIAWLASLAAPANLFAQANGKIVFEREGCIWVMNPDGSNPTKIGNELDTLCPGNNRDPVWSPDGTKIAFLSDTNTTLPTNVYVMNADGTHLVRLPDTFNAVEPAWSPDGTKIAFAANRDGVVGSIYTITVDGTNTIQRVTNAPPASDQAPTWSPDGSRIAFWTNESSIGLHIAAVNANGSGRTAFLPNIAFGMNPAWSPDGTRIAYDGPNIATGGNYIWVMNADGTGQTQVTSGAFTDVKPAWAPDGTKIAFERNISGQTHVIVMNADGSGQTNITPAAVTNAPDWQRLQTCQLTVTPTYTGGTLNLGFSLANTAPAIWTTWLLYTGGGLNLWSIPIPAVNPLVSFNVPIPGFPAIGPVGLLTVISTPARGLICGDFKITNAAP
jgi:Tol biopolymer transport system component